MQGSPTPYNLKMQNLFILMQTKNGVTTLNEIEKDEPTTSPLYGASRNYQ